MRLFNPLRPPLGKGGGEGFGDVISTRKGRKNMDLRVFEKMNPSELKSYLQFLLWHYRVMDAFWFLYVAEKFDQPTRKGSTSRFGAE